jgi:tRNA dimethylallyltransferase
MSSTAASDVAEFRVVCGPTAAGKSALATAIADREPIAVISADSRQVYRGFDVGTAKPAAEERARVPHFGIDLVEPGDRFTAADWADAVPGWIAATRSQARTPVIVGGTGFYLRALTAPLFVEPGIDATRREQLREYLGQLSAGEVRRWCEAIDPARAVLGRAQWERAIEVALLSGHRISELHAARPRASCVTARYLVVDPGPVLAEWLTSRVDTMLAAGWLDEVAKLAQQVPATAGAWSATGYEALRDVVTGTRSLDEARGEVVVRTRQYAKRQRTWFRHQLAGERVTRLDPRVPDAIARAMAWFHGEDS